MSLRTASRFLDIEIEVRGMGGSSDSWDEAGVGFRLEELEGAYPVDDELDADDEDQEAHNSCDRADAGSSELVDPGRSVAQQQRDDGGCHRNS